MREYFCSDRAVDEENVVREVVNAENIITLKRGKELGAHDCKKIE